MKTLPVPLLVPISLVAALLAASSDTYAAPSAEASAAAPKPAAVARGKYLVTTSGCHDCHTPFKMGANGPEPDFSRALSGHPEQLQMPPAPQLPEGPWLVVSAATNTAHAGPWGVSFTANLTPDADTGLGPWTQRNFIDTIRTGRHMGRGRPVLPPMPIPVYRNFTDGDLAAIYAYLRTVPAVKNRVPDPLPPAGAAPVAHK
ncbi:c-type cytochrome [Aquabacterium sp.]|uniref:c-type cytochrome n=1 Tax=Aquabacterium sp. TaxID=1872578 RepID=UPI002BFA9DF9|nr:c-type cytochrome [Aquabacterium sp.]HSW05431.1 c-type cytochrome [Aquabacterium sp.]